MTRIEAAEKAIRAMWAVVDRICKANPSVEDLSVKWLAMGDALKDMEEANDGKTDERETDDQKSIAWWMKRFDKSHDLCDALLAEREKLQYKLFDIRQLVNAPGCGMFLPTNLLLKILDRKDF